MFDRVLIAIDGTPPSASVFHFGLRIARQLNAGVDFVHVPNPREKLSQREVVDWCRAEASRAAVTDICVHFENAPAATCVLDAIKKLEAKLCVIGQDAHSKLAEHVIHRQHKIPVLTVRTDLGAVPAEYGDPHDFKDLVVPFDGENEAINALRDIGPVAKALGGSVTLVHAIQDGEGNVVHDWSAAHEALEVGRQQLDLLVLPARTQIAHEPLPVPDIICGVARKYDLLVMGTHGRGGLRRLFTQNLTDDILHKCAVPVLVVPPGAKS